MNEIGHEFGVKFGGFVIIAVAAVYGVPFVADDAFVMTMPMLLLFLFTATTASAAFIIVIVIVIVIVGPIPTMIPLTMVHQ